MAGVPSSLLNTESASHAVTMIPMPQLPMTRMMGLAPDCASSIKSRVSTSVEARAGAVLNGSLGYAAECLDCDPTELYVKAGGTKKKQAKRATKKKKRKNSKVGKRLIARNSRWWNKFFKRGDFR